MDPHLPDQHVMQELWRDLWIHFGEDPETEKTANQLKVWDYHWTTYRMHPALLRIEDQYITPIYFSYRDPHGPPSDSSVFLFTFKEYVELTGMRDTATNSPAPSPHLRVPHGDMRPATEATQQLPLLLTNRPNDAHSAMTNPGINSGGADGGVYRSPYSIPPAPPRGLVANANQSQLQARINGNRQDEARDVDGAGGISGVHNGNGNPSTTPSRPVANVNQLQPRMTGNRHNEARFEYGGAMDSPDRHGGGATPRGRPSTPPNRLVDNANEPRAQMTADERYNAQRNDGSPIPSSARKNIGAIIGLALADQARAQLAADKPDNIHSAARQGASPGVAGLHNIHRASPNVASLRDVQRAAPGVASPHGIQRVAPAASLRDIQRASTDAASARDIHRASPAVANLRNTHRASPVVAGPSEVYRGYPDVSSSGAINRAPHPIAGPRSPCNCTGFHCYKYGGVHAVSDAHDPAPSRSLATSNDELPNDDPMDIDHVGGHRTGKRDRDAFEEQDDYPLGPLANPVAGGNPGDSFNDSRTHVPNSNATFFGACVCAKRPSSSDDDKRCGPSCTMDVAVVPESALPLDEHEDMVDPLTGGLTWSDPVQTASSAHVQRIQKHWNTRR